MRIRMGLALGVALALLAAGCGGPADDGDGVATAAGTATPTASASAGAQTPGDADAPVKFAQCMREQGIGWFPDPKPGPNTLKVPKGQDRAKFEAAMQACREFAPDGGTPQKADPEMLEQMRQMAQCMRDNGVPQFPDPDPNGRLMLDTRKLGIDPDDPVFQAAQKACDQYRPKGAGPRGQQREGDA